jgi:cob(I)alamin adenosyltransferase
VIDKFERELLPINFFILPGGSIESSLLHISRSIARRAETTVTALSKSQTINPAIITYLNRLSDMLFVAARLINKRMGVEDVPWRSSPKY